MGVVLFRLVLWVALLAGLTLFWVSVFDSDQRGLSHSLSRNASQAAGILKGGGTP